MSHCSVIIPVHNHASLTRQCITTLLRTPAMTTETEIIVVDDASTDLTPVLLAEFGGSIRIVTHATNAGFAVSCNDGAAIAEGEYLVFLNNDTIPLPGWLDALATYADGHPQAAVVGAKLLYPNDTIQHAGVVISQEGWPFHIYLGFPSDHPAVNKSRRFQVVTGGCALMRREIFEAAGGFDTCFLNSYEDVDLCLRFGEAGYEVHYCHESVVYHLESVSRTDRPPQEDSANTRTYESRWRHRIVPDDLRYYLEDGMLNLRYTGYSPINIEVSPLFAVAPTEGEDRQIDRLLDRRARQMFSLLKENIALRARLAEAELQLTAENP